MAQREKYHTAKMRWLFSKSITWKREKINLAYISWARNPFDLAQIERIAGSEDKIELTLFICACELNAGSPSRLRHA